MFSDGIFSCRSSIFLGRLYISFFPEAMLGLPG